jgi:fatty acid desaturase
MSMTPLAARQIRQLRAQLPPEAFEPNRRRILEAVLHSAVIVIGYAGVRLLPWLGPIAAVVIGHSLACLAFIGHEASHNAIVRQRYAKQALCLWTLCPNIVPPTMWNRLHNDAHHQHAGTPADPDRPFLQDEYSTPTKWYARLTYPSADTFIGILVLAHFVVYLARNIITVFYRESRKPVFVPARPRYSPRERWVIGGELVAMMFLQVGVFYLVGADWSNYLWVSPAALVVASAVVMAYTFTNHFLNPITITPDPVSGTTSVIVPPVCNWLHGHFSYHTEHHLFPALNSDYYPLVSEALQSHAPGQYQQLPFAEAWRRLWRVTTFRTISTATAQPDAPTTHK